MGDTLVWYSCNDVPGWDTKDCCGSCHDDYEEIDYEMCHYEKDGKDYHICCRCLEWMKETFGEKK